MMFDLRFSLKAFIIVDVAVFRLSSQQPMTRIKVFYMFLAITCGEAPNISHASVVSLSSRDIGSAAEYSCDLGFAVRKAGSFESNFQLTCSLNESLISAYWSDPPTCEGSGKY